MADEPTVALLKQLGALVHQHGGRVIFSTGPGFGKIEIEKKTSAGGWRLVKTFSGPSIPIAVDQAKRSNIPKLLADEKRHTSASV